VTGYAAATTAGAPSLSEVEDMRYDFIMLFSAMAISLAAFRTPASGELWHRSGSARCGAVYSTAPSVEGIPATGPEFGLRIPFAVTAQAPKSDIEDSRLINQEGHCGLEMWSGERPAIDVAMAAGRCI